MGIRKIGAEFIFSNKGNVLTDHVVVVEKNRIVAIVPKSEYESFEIESLPGWLIPGFINTHCHLELSHMKDMLATGTGLIPFIKGVVTQREAAQEAIHNACAKADHAMWNAGIMAVGDISNTTDSFLTKESSNIDYYTFVEAFDLLQQNNTESEFVKSKLVFEQAQNSKSIVPHAPYSCSIEMLKKINQLNAGENKTVSIHNQETIHENNFFL